ncbi:MAG: DUF3892 domain-containing protein [Cellulosilyticaceae bacterium]
MDNETKIVNGQVESAEAFNQTAAQTLANNANMVVSEGGQGARSITKLIKESQDVVGYELSDGSHVSVSQAVEMAKANQLEHVGVSVSKTGEPYLRSLPDGDESNNLSHLPSITQ